MLSFLVRCLVVVSFIVLPDSLNAQNIDLDSIAELLDQRQEAWFDWETSERGETSCISCHTNLTFALVRPKLTQSDDQLNSYDRLIDNTKARISTWESIQPFYGGSKKSQSLGTEAIMNALVLALDDQHFQRAEPSESTRKAFQHMWQCQITDADHEAKGSWPWLDFHLHPWESEEAAYYGTALAAIAVGISHTSEDDVENIKLMKDFLLSKFGSEQSVGNEDLNLYNKIHLLWASCHLEKLLNAEQRSVVIDAVFEKQAEDGGWALSSLGNWNRSDNTDQETKSDAYATGLIVHVLVEAGFEMSDERLMAAVEWLKSNHDSENHKWYAHSLNEDRASASTMVRLFMDDAATAMATLALLDFKD